MKKLAGFVPVLRLSYIRVLQSYDPTTHFETTVKDVLAMYTRITGKVGLPEHSTRNNQTQICYCEAFVFCLFRHY